MQYEMIKEACFVSRPNRFIANAEIDGEQQTIHVKTTGRCRELLIEGARIFLEDHGEDRKKRKTRYSLVAVEKRETDRETADRQGNIVPRVATRLVNIDSQAPNKAVAEALIDGSIRLPGLDEQLVRIKPEMTFGGISRFDFYVEDQTGNKAYIEVKGVTLEENGVARFPDAPTERGVKHIRELCKAHEQGFGAFVIFVVQMKGIFLLEPNDVTHPAFGEALRDATAKGVEILAYDCIVEPDSMTISEPVAVKL